MTQYMENYGAHDWDGVGSCPQHWKMKGGDEYFLSLEGFNPDHEFAEKNLQMIVDGIRDQVEWDNVGSREYIVGYEVVEDDFMSQYEKDQLKFDGTIAFPTQVLETVSF